MSPPIPTQVTVTHTITDPNTGAVTSFSQTFTIGNNLNHSFQIIPISQDCNQYCVRLEADPNLGCWIGHVWHAPTGIPPTQWGDGNLQPVFCFNTPGQHSVSHSIIDGCFDIDLPMTVNAQLDQPLSPLDAGFVSNIPDPACPPVDISFTSNPNHPMNTHEWIIEENGMTVFTTTDPNFNFNFPNPGTYVITHTVTEPICGDMVTETETITLLPAAELDISTMSQGNCAGGVASLNYNICLTGANSGLTSDIDLNLDLPAGVTIAPLGNFYPDGEETLANMEINGPCASLTLILDLDAGLESGDLLNIILNAASDDLCLEESTFSETVTVETAPVAGFTWINDGCTPEVIFTSTAQNGDNFSWDFGDSNTGTNNPETHIYANFGDYTVTHTVTNECGSDAVSESISIMEIPLTADFTFEEFTCMLVNFTSEYDMGTHFWDFGDGGTSDEQHPQHGYTTAGPHTVVHTVTHPVCGTFTTTMQITVDDACLDDFECPCTTGGLNVGAANTTTLLSESGLPDDMLVNQNNCLAINGQLVIDGIDSDVYSILGGEIRMQPGAEILIQNGELVLQAVLQNIDGIPGFDGIHGCGIMWRSITVETGAKLTMVFNKVQDAQYAISARHLASISVNGNLFDRNHVGIYTPPLGGIQTVLTPFPISLNTFDNTGNGLLPPFDNIPTYDPSTPYAGVELRNGLLFFGTGGGITNIIRNMRNGIVAERSLLVTEGVQIENMVGGTLFPQILNINDAEGTGIFLRGAAAFVTNSSVESAVRGIYAFRSGLAQIEENVISDVDYGATVINSDNLPLIIEKNQIEFHYRGVRVFNSPNARVMINENDPMTFTANVPGQLGVGIDLLSGSGATVNQYDPFSIVQENNIILKGQANGISLNSVGNLEINYNDILYDDVPITPPAGSDVDFVPGILLTGADNNFLYDNTVVSTNLDFLNPDALSDFFFTGMDVSISKSNTFCCNSFDGTNVGTYFLNSCIDTELRHTNFGQHSVGLWCTVDAVLTDQDHAGNLWNGTYNGFWAQHWGIESHVGDSEFLMEDSDPSTPFPDIEMDVPLWPQLIFSNYEWFKYNPIGQSTDCGLDNEYCAPPPFFDFTEKEQLKEAYINIANGDYLSSEFGDVLQWESTRYLYKTLLENSPLLGQNQDVDDFFNDSPNNSVGFFHNVESQISDLYQPDEATSSQLETDFNSVDDLVADIAVLDNQLENASNLEDSLAIASQKIPLMADLNVAVQSIFNTIESEHTNRIALTGQVLTANSGLPGNMIYEQNEQQINELYLNTVTQDIFDLNDSQLSTITSIAAQCPSEGGSAVYGARALLSLFQEINYNDFELCDISEARSFIEKANKERAKNESILVYPNPASQTLNIQLTDSEIDKAIRIELKDLTGRVLKVTNINGKDSSVSIPINELPQGIYICTGFENNRQIFAEKFVVLH